MAEISKITKSNVEYTLRDEGARNGLVTLRNDCLLKYPTITDEDDLNDLIDAGVYCYASASIPDHAPAPVGGVVCIFQSQNEMAQVVYTIEGTSYIRYRGSSGTWTTEWKRNGENVITPDEYPGTDSQKIQAALDAFASTGGTILLTREYTLTSNIRNTLDTNYNIQINLVGIGQNAKINFGQYYFSGSLIGRSGGLCFENVTLQGTATAFDCSALIRMHFTNCYFIGFTDVFYAGNERGSGNKIFQSIYVDMCTFRNIMGAVFNNAYNAVYDIHFTNSIVEASRNFFVCNGQDYVAGIYVSHNCIEGLLGSVFVASPNQAIDQCIFDSNYFELNAGYFDLSSMLFPANMTICDNIIGESHDVPFVNLPGYVIQSNGFLTVERNTLTDKTSPCHVFGLPENATHGNYKGVYYKQNRFNYLTDNNAHNSVLPFNGTTQPEFSGSDFDTFVNNALVYFATAQSKPSEHYSVRWTGNDCYEFNVNQYQTGIASAFIFHPNKAVVAYYNGSSTTIKELVFAD